jgi:hypothetical protein
MNDIKIKNDELKLKERARKLKKCIFEKDSWQNYLEDHCG